MSSATAGTTSAVDSTSISTTEISDSKPGKRKHQDPCHDRFPSNKKHRRRPVKVGMPTKNSWRKQKYDTDPHYHEQRNLVFEALKQGNVKRYFENDGWFIAKFKSYDPRTDNVQLTYPADNDEEICPFKNLMDSTRTRISMGEMAHAAMVLLDMASRKR